MLDAMFSCSIDFTPHKGLSPLLFEIILQYLAFSSQRLNHCLPKKSSKENKSYKPQASFHTNESNFSCKNTQ